MIRKATKEDIDWLVDIAIKDMFSLVGQYKVYNPTYLREVFIPHLIDSGIVLVEEDFGAILGYTTAHPYNPEIRIAAEFMWWVREDKRNGSTGYRLLDAFEKELKSQKIDYLALSLMAKSPVTSLEKRGYVLNEYSYVKEL